MAVRARWPVDDRTRARVARRYFVDQATKVEIGAEFGLTRFQVARLVQDCLDDGTVTITVHGPEHVDDALSDRLARRFSLADALVTSDLPGASRYLVGMLTARLKDGDVLAVGGSELVEPALAAALRTHGLLPRCAIVQACGVAGLDDHTIELVKSLAAGCAGEAYPLYAPFLSREAADAAALRVHPLVAVATGRFDRVAAAVLGVRPLDGSGLWTAADTAVLDAAGAVATLGPVPVGADGSARPTVLDERAIGLSAAQLARIPFVVAVAAGDDVVGPLRATLRGGLIHAAVTDVATATALLGEDLPRAAGIV